MQGLDALVLVAPALVAQPTEQGEAVGKPGHLTASNQSLSTAFAHGHLANPPAPPTRHACSLHEQHVTSLCQVCNIVWCI